MASPTSQTQESTWGSRISHNSRRSNGTTNTIDSIGSIDSSSGDNGIDAPPQANSRKRSRPQSEDTDSESSEQPFHTKKPKSSPPDPICIHSCHKVDKHPFLLNVRTFTSAPNPNLSHDSALFLGSPPEQSCAICLDAFSPFSSRHLSRHAQCTPIYHTACLERWVAGGNPTCPYCRGELLPIPAVPTFFESENEEESEQENRILRIVLGHIVVGSVPLVWQWSAIDRLVAASIVGSPQVSGVWGRDWGAEQQENEEDEGEEEEWEEAVMRQEEVDGEEQQQDAEEEPEVADGEQLLQQEGDQPPQSPITRAIAAVRRRFDDYGE